MRDDKKAPNLGEIMGKGFEHRTKLSMDDLPKLLGAKMQHIPYDRVGRIRLINALHQRFGPGFKNVPGISDILEHFDKEAHTTMVVKMNHKANHEKAKLKMAKGGEVPAKDCYDDGGEVPTGSSTQPPVDRTKRVAGGTVKGAAGADITKPSTWFADGGQLPGTPNVPGDSLQNDTKTIKASPGEIIIPNSITQSSNPGDGAKNFVEQIKLNKAMKRGKRGR